MGNRAGEVTTLFGTEDRTFRLTVTRWEKVQEACKAGPPEIARRLAIGMLPKPGGLAAIEVVASGRLGQWNVQDVRAPILQGLIGGGMAAEEAERLCRELVDDRPLAFSVGVAFEVVMASLLGPDEEPLVEEQPPGEPAGGPAPRPKRSPTTRSRSPKSGGSPRS